jgi:hypothetical protein
MPDSNEPGMYISRSLISTTKSAENAKKIHVNRFLCVLCALCGQFTSFALQSFPTHPTSGAAETDQRKGAKGAKAQREHAGWQRTRRVHLQPFDLNRKEHKERKENSCQSILCALCVLCGQFTSPASQSFFVHAV